MILSDDFRKALRGSGHNENNIPGPDLENYRRYDCLLQKGPSKYSFAKGLLPSNYTLAKRDDFKLEH